MSDDDLLQINVAGRPIGILGFKAVLEALAPTLAQSTDDVLAQELVTRLSKKNYIPEKVKDGVWESPGPGIQTAVGAAHPGGKTRRAGD